MLSSYLSSFLVAIAAVSALPADGAGPGRAVASIEIDFPDPSIIQVGDTWYSFATNGNGVNVQFSSTKSVQGSWARSAGYDALPTLPAWASATRPEIWAPDVVQIVCISMVSTLSSPSTNRAFQGLRVRDVLRCQKSFK